MKKLFVLMASIFLMVVSSLAPCADSAYERKYLVVPEFPPPPQNANDLRAFLANSQLYPDAFNRTFTNGKTPLHLAMEFEAEDIVASLLREGVSPFLPLSEPIVSTDEIEPVVTSSKPSKRFRAKKAPSVPNETAEVNRRFSITAGFLLGPRRQSTSLDLGDTSPCFDSQPALESIPLHIAAQKNLANIAGLLINYERVGDQILHRDANGNTPIHLAVLNNSIETLTVLLNGPAQGDDPDYDKALLQCLNPPSRQQMSPLALAIMMIKTKQHHKEREHQKQFSFKMAELLLKKNADPLCRVYERGEPHLNLYSYAVKYNLNNFSLLLLLHVGVEHPLWHQPELQTLKNALFPSHDEFRKQLQNGHSSSQNKIIRNFLKITPEKKKKR